MDGSLRMVAFEVTRNCNLSCIHCRAASHHGYYDNELSLEECKNILYEISTFSSPTVILTGGEPLLRDDIFDIASFGTKIGLKMVLATNGTLLNEHKIKKLQEGGIKRVSLSIDGKNETSHDGFRRQKGSFSALLKAADSLKRCGLPFQINTTVTKINVEELKDIHDLAVSLGAIAWHVFLLVPVGRGKNLKGKELTAFLYEKVLKWIYEKEKENLIDIKVTCAPQYNRIVIESGGKSKSGGCLAGKHFLFISHRGIAQPCGYLEVEAGDVKREGVRRVWENSNIFKLLREYKNYKGKCGKCKYLRICGGCRARAFEASGNPLEEEPCCLF